ncbi:FtsQ-type POTRA domain-containing protein [Spiribacter sp. C176]|uniref:Cell division protein FtsQ n=1 Tax=Spiribacter salilacus TaxID=2664894 RepID=A0A6N7QQJ3_9GAMM|nr:cell division protein FtsQ/DivIB [Spiribacter salilacus]MRH78676.1 FtsQ-type POTRA domain-containing protein [Spiribacter salilacus]
MIGRLSLGVMLFGLLAGGYWLSTQWAESPPLPIQTVRFDGELAHLRQEDLRAAVLPNLGGGLLGSDVLSIRQSLEALAWVQQASVRRVWPDALEVHIVEQRPIAQWGEGALLNAQARVFRPRRLPEGLPALAGPPSSAERVLTRFQEIRALLQPVDIQVIGLKLDERRAWTVVLDNGGLIRLGRQDTEERLARFIAAWPQVEDLPEQMLSVADLRYPNGFALLWQPEETVDDT